MSTLTLALIGLAVWLLFLVTLTAALVIRTRHRRRERRSGDRRVGLPDLRPVQVERRRGTDRRGVTA